MEISQKQYELVFILSSQLDGEDLERTKKEIEEIIAKFEGKIEFKQLGKRELAYPINKQGQGIFVNSHLSIVPGNINNLSKELKLNKQILRHLISQLLPSAPKKAIDDESSIKRKRAAIAKRKMAETKEKSSFIKATESKVKLEEIDKKLDEIIEEI